MIADCDWAKWAASSGDIATSKHRQVAGQTNWRLSIRVFDLLLPCKCIGDVYVLFFKCIDIDAIRFIVWKGN